MTTQRARLHTAYQEAIIASTPATRGSTSLDPEAEPRDIRKTMDRTICPRWSGRVLKNVRTGKRIVAGCKTYGCEVCGPRRVRMLTHAIAQVSGEIGQTRMVTLTRAPEEPAKRRQKMADMSRWAKKNGYKWEVCWATEVGKGGMTHIHAVHWGDYLPQAELQERWGAIVDIRATYGGQGEAADYVLKGFLAADYVTKGFRGETYAAALELNDGRPMRWTRGFFGGRTADECAKTYRTKTLGWTYDQWVVVDGEEALEWERVALTTRCEEWETKILRDEKLSALLKTFQPTH